jgi:hypothetical protein
MDNFKLQVFLGGALMGTGMAMAIPIEDKIRFFNLATELEPESVMEAERSGIDSAAKHLQDISEEWEQLEKKNGVKVNETMALGWAKEINQFHRESLEDQKQWVCKKYGEVSGLEIISSNENGTQWCLPSADRTIGVLHIEKKESGPEALRGFIVTSSFAEILDGEYEVGAFPTLHQAFAQGMKYLEGVTLEKFQEKTSLPYKHISFALHKLPLALQQNAFRHTA